MDTDSIKKYLEGELNTRLQFLEYRVAIVIDDLTGPINYQKCSDEDFYAEAEEQGTIFTLKGFERFIYEGKLTEMMNNVESPNYLFPRFIPVFEDYTNRTYVDTRELKEYRYEL